jgi:hypothetical protein
MKQKAGKPVKPAAPITDDPRFNSMHNAPVSQDNQLVCADLAG